MDNTVPGLLTTLTIDIIIFSILFFLFIYYRKLRSFPLEIEVPNITLKQPYFQESTTPIITLFKQVYRFSNSELIEKLSFTSYLYLELHRHILIGLGVMTLLGLLILIPIYSAGHDSEDQELDKISITNILLNDNYMIAPCVMIFTFSIVLYYISYLYSKNCKKEELNNSNPSLYTILVYGLPQDKSASALQQEFKDFILKEFGEERIQFTYVVSNYTQAYSLDQLLQQYSHKLWHYNQTLQQTGKRPMKRTLKCKKYDLISYTENYIETLKKDYELALEHADTSSTGYAVISCNTSTDAKFIYENFKGDKMVLKSHTWVLKPAPPPNEILWENLGGNRNFLWVYRICMFCVFLVVFLIFLTPTTFLNFINTILMDIGIYDAFDYILQNYLSTLILLLYQSVILPKFIGFLVKRERQADRAGETVSALRKFLIYNLVYVFLLPILDISFLKMLHQMYNDGFSEWQLFLADSISHAGLFFTNFIIHQTFIVQGVNLLDPTRLIEIKTKQLAAISQEERLMAYEAEDYPWAAEYAKSITNLTIILSISIIYPLILPFGFLYYCMKLWVQKYLIVCVYYVNPYAIGTRLLKSIVTSLLFTVLVFQWISSLQLIISKSKKMSIVGIFIFVLGLVIFVLIYKKTNRFIKIVKKKLIKDNQLTVNQPLIMIDPKLYIHPIELKLQDQSRLDIV